MANNWIPLSTVYTLLSLVLLHDAKHVVIHEVNMISNNDYMKAFITIQNGTFKSQHSATVNVDLMVYKNMSKGMLLHIFVDYKADSEYQRLVATDMDFCATNVSYADDPMIAILTETIKLYGNITISCPFYASYYVLNEFPLDANKVVINIAPPGDFRVGVVAKQRVARKAIPIIDALIYISVIEDDEDVEDVTTGDDGMDGEDI